MTTNSPTITSTPLIASRAHLFGFFMIVALTIFIGYRINARASAVEPAPEPTTSAMNSSSQQQSHLALYLPIALADLAFFYYCWAGVHNQGVSLFKLARLRQGSLREWVIDAIVLIPFTMIWELVANVVANAMSSGGSKAVDAMLPSSVLDVSMWVLLSCIAGLCEELIFRGYLQRQFHVIFGNLGLAIFGQAICFGVIHAYQGWRPVVVISVLGVLYGVLAASRPSLRVNVVSHAFVDVWEGWLKFVIR